MLVHVPSHILSFLDWWKDLNNICKGARFALRQQSFILVTNALDLGWRPNQGPLKMQGLWYSQDLSLHTNIRELWAIQ